MARVILSQHMREGEPADAGPHRVGPFVTISRQPGCWGFSLGLLLLDILNEDAAPGKAWRILNRHILERLARETNIASELLDQLRRAKPSMIVDFFNSFSETRIPSGLEIRNRITTIIRSEAIKGHAIIVGQGGAGATADVAEGISIRLEAPEDWRADQLAFREQMTKYDAIVKLTDMERQREHLRKIYEMRFPRKPPFQLTYDCSVFSLAQIAQQVVYAMKLRGLV